MGDSLMMTSASFCAPSLAASTSAVVLGQVGFLVTLYAPAIWAKEVTPERFHISAVLDDDFRSTACAVVGGLTILPMVMLEHSRDLPLPGCRLGLAIATGLGILLTCCVRESTHVNSHRCCAVLAFFSAVLLVMLIATLADSGHEAGFALMGGLVLTGLGQASNILADNLKLSFRPLPSWALGTLEIGLVVGFGACMALHASAGATDLPEGCDGNSSFGISYHSSIRESGSRDDSSDNSSTSSHLVEGLRVSSLLEGLLTIASSSSS